jgi:hypothetical protein
LLGNIGKFRCEAVSATRRGLVFRYVAFSTPAGDSIILKDL